MPSVLDFALDANGDLAIGGGDFSLVADLAGIEQLADIALSTVLGEWFADQSLGVDWFGVILVKNPNLIVARAILRAALLAVPGVISVDELDITIDKTRRATITWSATTDLGALVSTTEVA
jgi:hypothetical protein